VAMACSDDRAARNIAARARSLPTFTSQREPSRRATTKRKISSMVLIYEREPSFGRY
jgi:hypothetical protein